MDDIKEKINDLTSHVEDLAQTYYRLSLLNATQKATNITATALTTIVVAITGFFVLLLGGVALSLWLGDLLNSRAGGFLLGAGFFLLVMVTIILLRKAIIFPFFRDRIIRKFYD
jgi:predicted lipid-binding transport protein (Tim44 family)